MFVKAHNFADIFRGVMPYCLLIGLPILIFCVPTVANDLNIQRLSQFDVNGMQFGCRGSILSLEAKSLQTWSKSYHCVLASLLDITIEDFNRIKQNAGGLIIMLPNNMFNLSDAAKEHINQLEQSMLTKSVAIPVYFAQYNKYFAKIIDDITYARLNNNRSSISALGNWFARISFNGYLVTVSGASNLPNKNARLAVISGELLPSRLQTKSAIKNLSIIIITASLKTFGIFNDYPLNSDASILLLLIEMFSKLNFLPSTAAKYRLIFLLSESGVLLNYQGSKKWLEHNGMLRNVEFVLCLDTIASSMSYNQSNQMYMHVSKPAKEKTSISHFLQLLQLAAAHYDKHRSFEEVHKKINLTDSQLAWEHECFSMKRYTALTLSSVKSPTNPLRYTIFKDNDLRILEQTLTAARIIAEALASYVYGIEEFAGVFNGYTSINKETVSAFLQMKSLSHNKDIKHAFKKYLKNVKILYDKPELRDPDFMLYDARNAKMNFYKVKPAVFDLLLTIIIAAYLFTIYHAILEFNYVYDIVAIYTKTNINANSYDRGNYKVH